MTFVKGQSGNPGGLRKTTANQRMTITQMAREIAPQALQTLKKVMLDKRSTMTARAIAADRILDRAYGKAPQAVAIVGSITTRKASELTDDELAAIVAGATLPALAPPTIEGEMVNGGMDVDEADEAS